MKDKVYDIVKQIPYGKVITYSQIAEKLGNKKLARVVGNILHKNPNENQIPCYKVVSSKGHIRDLTTTGKFGLGVDVDNGFKPSYAPIKGKKKVIKQL